VPTIFHEFRLLTIISSCAVSIGTDSEVVADAFLGEVRTSFTYQVEGTHHYNSQYKEFQKCFVGPRFSANVLHVDDVTPGDNVTTR
jgi:hypothetical protein